MRGGRSLRVTPFATGRTERAAIGASWDTKGDGGFDLKWSITPSLVLDGTYRTDFAQVEADQVQINLTRFSLLFPEKRQFFLESPGSFQIGLTAEESGISGNMLVPFFTRRIGLSEDNTPIPVVAGARLTGQSGETTIGLLNITTDRDGDRPGRQLHGPQAGAAAAASGPHRGRILLRPRGHGRGGRLRVVQPRVRRRPAL